MAFRGTPEGLDDERVDLCGGKGIGGGNMGEAYEGMHGGKRDHAQAVPPQKLIDLVGQTRAMSMIALEQDRQSAAVAARNARLQVLSEQIKVAQQQVEMLT